MANGTCTKSCLTCKWAKDMSFGGSYDEPPSVEWECNNESDAAIEADEKGVDHGWSPEETAAECPCYEYEDKSEADYDGGYYEDYMPTEEEYDAMIDAQVAHERARMIEVGWLDPETGEPTDAYYVASDFAYDCYRGR